MTGLIDRNNILYYSQIYFFRIIYLFCFNFHRLNKISIFIGFVEICPSLNILKILGLPLPTVSTKTNISQVMMKVYSNYRMAE